VTKPTRARLDRGREVAMRATEAEAQARLVDDVLSLVRVRVGSGEITLCASVRALGAAVGALSRDLPHPGEVLSGAIAETLWAFAGDHD
jgi:hypothetical protein